MARAWETVETTSARPLHQRIRSVGAWATNFLPSVDDVLVGHETSPSQGGDFRAHTQGSRVGALRAKQPLGLRSQSLPLQDKMIEDQAESAVGEHAGADVEKACVAGAEAEGPLGEAVFGNMTVGGGEDGVFDGAECALGRGVVVGVERSVSGAGSSRSAGGRGGEPQGGSAAAGAAQRHGERRYRGGRAGDDRP